MAKARFKIMRGRGKHILRVPKLKGKGYEKTVYEFGTENEIIECEEWELGGARDKFEKLDDPASSSSSEPLNLAEILRVYHKGGGKYNVVNIMTGAVMNSELLSKDEAEALLDQLISKGEDVDDKGSVEDPEDVAGGDRNDPRRGTKSTTK